MNDVIKTPVRKSSGILVDRDGKHVLLESAARRINSHAALVSLLEAVEAYRNSGLQFNGQLICAYREMVFIAAEEARKAVDA